MNGFLLGVFVSKLTAVLAGSTPLAPAFLLLGIALAALVLEALRRSAGEKTRIVQRIELPPTIVQLRARANTRRHTFGA